MSEARIYGLAWLQVPGVGPVLLRRIQSHFGSLAAAWRVGAAALAEVEGIGMLSAQRIVEERSHIQPEQLYERYSGQNTNFWSMGEPDYPQILQEIPDPPVLLHYQGQVEALQGPGVAIVGTRSPSEYGKRWARRLAVALSKAGFTIISGLAVGIDSIAHTACLAAGGRTIAVLGCGVDVIYPPENRQLYHEILETGLVVSEYSQGTLPMRATFPQRNRIIAGLSRAVLIIEAPQKSGALITAYIANDYGREVYALPGNLDNPKAMGCLGLISRGAQLILGEGHLLEMLGRLPQLDQVLAEPTSPSLPEHLLPVWQAVAEESTSFDRIIQSSRMNTDEVNSALLQLELMGLITQLPGMFYQRL